MAKKKRNRRTKRELEGVEREPNGQPVRSRTPRKRDDPRKVAIWARIRHFGVRPIDADQPEAGDAVGRAYLAGKLQKYHLEAAIEYRKIHITAMSAIQAPDPLAKKDGLTPNPEVSEEYAVWAVKALGRWKPIRDRLRDIGVETAVFRCVIEDQDAELVGLNAVDHGLAIVADYLGIKTVRQNVAKK